MARTTPVNTGYNIINGSVTGTNGSKVDTWVEWKVTSTSVVNNTSNVRIILYAQATQSLSTSYSSTENYGWVGYDNGNKNWMSKSGYDFSNKQLITFGDHTFTITHNSDGTKTLTIQGGWSTNGHSSYIKDGSVSGQVTLPQIARASTISSMSTSLGTAGTISITRQSSDFTHTLTYSFGSSSGTITTKTSNTSVSWTPPVSLISQFGTNEKTKTGTLTCETFSGNTSVGTTTSTLTLTIPSSTLASVSGTFGTALTLTATNACASGLTYTFAYNNGSSWQSIASTTSKTQSWTPNTNLIANVSDSASGTINIRVITYRGTTAINTATATATLAVPKNTSSAISGTIGTALNIPITKPYSGLTSTITYAFGTASGTIATQTSSTSQSWTPPTSLLTQIPNSASGTGTITIQTFNGTASVGSNAYSLTLSAASSVVPTSSLTMTMVNDNQVVSGWGIYLQGYSKTTATLTANGVSGSTIKSMSVTGTGLNASSSPSTTTATLTGTSSVITSSGSLTYTGKVTDSRNRSATDKTSTISVVPYAMPSVSGVSLARSDSSGNIDTSGTYLKVAFTLVYSSANGHNSASVTLRYRVRGASSWTTYGTVTNGANLNINLDVSNNYEAQLLVSDALNSNIASATINIPSAERVINVNHTGKGMAIGGFSTEQGTFQEYYPAKFNDDIYVTNGMPIKAEDDLPLLTNGNFSQTSNDANTMMKVGAYYVGGAAVSNLPISSGYGILSVDRGSSATYRQTLNVYGTNRYFIRMYVSGQWHEWSEITKGYSDEAIRARDYNRQPIDEFLSVLQTYYDNRENLTYQNQTALNLTMYSSGTRKGIDCSTFVLLGLKGVPYGSSRYENGGDRDNNLSAYDWGIDIYSGATKDVTVSGVTTKEYYRYARDIAEWFFRNDRIYIHNDDWTNVKIGDILFWVDATDVGNQYIYNTLSKVHHVAVFTGLDNDGNVTYIDANLNRTYVVDNNVKAPSSSALTQVMYCGASPFDSTGENDLFSDFPSIVQYKKEQYDYETMMADIQNLVDKYSVINYTNLGTTYLGRDIPAIYIGSLNATYKTLIIAGEHGKEVHNTPLTLRIAETIAYNWNRRVSWDEKYVRQIFEDSCILIIPRQNPDGAELAYYGFDSIPSSQTNRTTLINNITNALVSYVRTEGFPIYNFKSDWSWRSQCVRDSATGRYTCPSYTFSEDDLYVWMSNLEGIDLQLNKWSSATFSNYSSGMSASYPARKLTQGQYRVQDDIGTNGWGATENAQIKTFLYNNGFLKNILNLHQLHPFIEWRESQANVTRDYEISKWLAEWCKTKLTNTNYLPLGIAGEAYEEDAEAYYATVETGYLYYPPQGNYSSSDTMVNQTTAFAYNQIPTMYEQYKYAFLRFHDVVGREQYFVHPLDNLTELTPINGKIMSVLTTGVDLDDIKTEGVYTCIGSNTYSNMPLSVTYGTLEVIKEKGNYFTTQRFTNPNITATRTFVNGSWSDWYSLYYNAYSTTYNGLTISARRYGNTTEVYVSGSPSSELSTAGGLVDVATLPSAFRPRTSYVNYRMLQADMSGQLNVTSAGVVRVGYTRTISTYTAVNVSSSIYGLVSYVSL